MIFVTVGTHEQPFDRLLKYIDELIDDGVINEKVVVQSGYCKYKPVHYNVQQFFPYEEMKKIVRDARIVITHGGPSSFILALQFGKIPIVVPRQKKYGEHVNNHQLEFCKVVAQNRKNIILVNKKQSLIEALMQYDKICAQIDISIVGNTQEFCRKLEAQTKVLLMPKM